MTALANPFERLFDTMDLPRIDPIPLIGLRAAMPNERLWELHAKEVDGTATAAERDELTEILARAEAECDDANRRQFLGAKL